MSGGGWYLGVFQRTEPVVLDDEAAAYLEGLAGGSREWRILHTPRAGVLTKPILLSGDRRVFFDIKSPPHAVHAFCASMQKKGAAASICGQNERDFMMRGRENGAWVSVDTTAKQADSADRQPNAKGSEEALAGVEGAADVHLVGVAPSDMRDLVVGMEVDGAADADGHLQGRGPEPAA
jgi:hypothetical protein